MQPCVEDETQDQLGCEQVDKCPQHLFARCLIVDTESFSPWKRIAATVEEQEQKNT